VNPGRNAPASSGKGPPVIQPGFRIAYELSCLRHLPRKANFLVGRESIRIIESCVIRCQRAASAAAQSTVLNVVAKVCSSPHTSSKSFLSTQMTSHFVERPSISIISSLIPFWTS
jgi:hypothetical protein